MFFQWLTFSVDRYVTLSRSCAEVWGNDAHVFNPRRYLNREKKEGVPTVGVYGDVLTFGIFASLICCYLVTHVFVFLRSCGCTSMYWLEILVSTAFQIQGDEFRRLMEIW